MLIGGLQKITLIDYPGRLAATVFLMGCNFRCPFCYNRELVLPAEIKKYPKIPEKEFFNFLKEKKKFLEGVVLCGGEPTINKDLPRFCRKIKKLGFLVKLDTNGSNPEMLKKLINEKLIDYVAMDIKAPLGPNFQFPIPNFQLNSKFQISKYEKTAGVKVNLEKIKESIELIKDSGIDYEFRTTIVPTIHTKEDIVEITKDISPAKKYFLQQFRPDKTLDSHYKKCKPFNQKEMELIQKECNKYLLTKLRS